MATLLSQTLISSSSSSASTSNRSRRIYAALRLPSAPKAKGLPLLKLPQMINAEEFRLREQESTASSFPKADLLKSDDDRLLSKLYAILEAVSDRAEMHAIIGTQRNNWNHHFTNSINSITLGASLMAGISSISMAEAFKLPSVILFAAATGMMLVVNKIQPSQLAEEQRNATRLWKQLETSIETTLALRNPTEKDVEEAMEKVLALDKAYPLPLLPGMLEKFPKIVEPTCWWPKKHNNKQTTSSVGNKLVNGGVLDDNGWSKELEEEMRGALRVLKLKDEEEYIGFAKLLSKINKALAISGPIFAGAAAMATALIGSAQALGPLPVLLAVGCGSLATVSNTFEHSAQIGMVFELSRNCAGFYRLLQEEIESNLEEKDVEKRENGELFETKMALQLGRSLSELKELRAYASCSSEDEDIKEFAGKLF